MALVNTLRHRLEDYILSFEVILIGLFYNACFSAGIPCDRCDGLYWKNDISQDSIIGHMWYFAILAEMLKTEPHRQRRVIQCKYCSLAVSD